MNKQHRHTKSNRGLLYMLAIVTTNLLILSGCGGGGGGSSAANGPGGGTTTPTISNAPSFEDFVDKELPKYFDDVSVEKAKDYDHDFSDFPDTIAQQDTNGNRPFFAPDEWFSGSKAQWPARNARQNFSATENPRIFGVEAVDLNNGLTGEDDSKLYWGIRNIDYTLSDKPWVPILIMIESIVKRDGTALYRSIQFIEGFFLVDSTDPGAKKFIRGNYELWVVEYLNDTGTPGLKIAYDMCLESEGIVDALNGNFVGAQLCN
jgi:hypothetical protein